MKKPKNTPCYLLFALNFSSELPAVELSSLVSELETAAEQFYVAHPSIDYIDITFNTNPQCLFFYPKDGLKGELICNE